MCVCVFEGQLPVIKPTQSDPEDPCIENVMQLKPEHTAEKRGWDSWLKGLSLAVDGDFFCPRNRIMFLVWIWVSHNYVAHKFVDFFCLFHTKSSQSVLNCTKRALNKQGAFKDIGFWWLWVCVSVCKIKLSINTMVEAFLDNQINCTLLSGFGLNFPPISHRFPTDFHRFS